MYNLMLRKCLERRILRFLAHRVWPRHQKWAGYVSLVILSIICMISGHGTADAETVNVFRGWLAEADRLRVQLAVTEMTAIGVLVEDISALDGTYPGVTNEILKPHDSLAKVIDDGDLSIIPTIDPWGASYLYWTDGTRYLVLSFGADGEEESRFRDMLLRDSWSRAEICPEADDLMFLNGKICKAPGD